MIDKKGIALALGFFDGVHLGHMQLLNKTIEIAQKRGYDSGVMTFEEHPLSQIFPRYTPWLISNNNEKIQLILKQGINKVYLNPFDSKLMNLSPEEFIRDYLLIKYPVKHLVVGFNYTFGYRGEGTTIQLIELGKKYGFDVSIVPPYILEKQAVSSTLIREKISAGDVFDVPKYLGYPYTIEGNIIEGKKLGRRYDLPTANLRLFEKKILPSSGVYYTQVKVLNQKFHGLTNLGFNPTFENHPYSIETYIYDFDENIYGETMSLIFVDRIRGEIKFNSIVDLVQQIKSDIQFVRKEYLENKEKNKSI